MAEKASLTLSLASIFNSGYVDIIYICVYIISTMVWWHTFLSTQHMFNLSLISHVSFNRYLTFCEIHLYGWASHWIQWLVWEEYPIFTPLIDLLSNYTTLHHLSKGNILFSYLFKQLYHPTSPIQRKYPIFTPLTDLLSNYTTYPKEISYFHTLNLFFKHLYHLSKGNILFSYP
jgi:hypothetical protein